MIECLKKNKKLTGYIDGKQYLDKKQKPFGSLEGNAAIKTSSRLILGKGTKRLFLQTNGAITRNQEFDYFGQTYGFLKDNKIYHLTDKHRKKLVKMKKKGLIQDDTIYNLPDAVLSQFPDALIYQISANKTQILDAKNRPVLALNGPTNEIEQLSNLDLFGIITVFLDLEFLFFNRNQITSFNWGGLIGCVGICIGVILLGALLIAGVIFNVFHWFEENPIIPGFEPLLFVILLVILVGLVILRMHSRVKEVSPAAASEGISSK